MLSKQTASEPQWPPRSPHEVLLSTPGGRERLRRMAGRQSPSPSPSRSRTSRASAALASRLTNREVEEDELENDDDGDDDEETLQLKLAEIQAKLKLKKLKAARAHKPVGSGSEAQNGHTSRPLSAPFGLQPQSRTVTTSWTDPIQRPKSQNAIEVPASPVRVVQPGEQAQRSPSRVLLGIDKGLKGKDVSLKRAPSYKRNQEHHTGQQSGGFLLYNRTHASALRSEAAETSKPPSFNDRLAAARTEEVVRHERQERIQKIRSKAFTLGRDEMEAYKTKAVDIPDIPVEPHTFTRDEILGAADPHRGGGGLRRSNTAPSIRSRSTREERNQADDPADLSPPVSRTRGQDEDSKDDASFEPYSGLHLSKRILPHPVVARATSAKRCYVLSDLLRKIKAPTFDLPDDECDIVVFAIVASKSDPRSHKPVLDSAGNPKPQGADRGKYMVLTLVDLSHEVELFLFKTGFDRYWKLTTGTVVAILNPTIMPPPPGRQDTGRWGLVINSDGDTILEIGTARDLGYCKSVKKDGALCAAWVHAKRTEYCEFHTNEAVRRTRSARNELNAADFSAGADHRKNSRHGPAQPKTKPSGSYDWETKTRVFVSGGPGASELMDREGGFVDRVERKEAAKRRLAAREKESEIKRRLGLVGGGAGREYMRSGSSTSGGLGSSVSSTSLSSANIPAERAAVDARSLGFLSGPRSGHVHLGPAKRKRPESEQGGGTVSRSKGAVVPKSALGWGSSLKDKLARMKDGENLKPSQHFTAAGTDTAGRSSSPVRKKTRFVTDKGIREAGRESLGVELAATAKGRRRGVVMEEEEDDDEELVIV